ncbi:MAG: DNA-directed RNA polymerase subunit omega [Acidimicrobiia bacterium]
MEKKSSLMEPSMEKLIENAGSKFTLVTLAAKRSREINDYYNQLGEGLGRIVPPQVTSVSRKPLSIALEEISNGDIIAMPLEEEDIKEIEQATLDASDIEKIQAEQVQDQEESQVQEDQTPDSIA